MPHDVLGEDSNFQVVGNLYGTHAVRPAAGTVLDGILYVELDTGNIYQAQSGSWAKVDAQSASTTFSYAGNPNSHVTANSIGDLCVDITNGFLYQASAADNVHWNILNGPNFTIQAGGGLGDIAALFTNNDADDPPLYLNNANTLGPQLRLGGINFFTYAGNPNTHVTAIAIGDLCADKTNGALYIAQVIDNSHWVAL